jgi:hypothetical protein
MKLILSLLLAFFLASCGGDKPADPNEAISPPAAEQPQVAKSEARKGIDLLTEFGVRPDFAHSINYDIVDKDKSGKPRHRVLLEVREGDMTTAVARMDALLVEQGYAKAKQSDHDGKVEQVFRKAGVPTLVLLSQSVATGPRLKQPDAVGSIHIMWNAR